MIYWYLLFFDNSLISLSFFTPGYSWSLISQISHSLSWIIHDFLILTCLWNCYNFGRHFFRFGIGYGVPPGIVALGLILRMVRYKSLYLVTFLSSCTDDLHAWRWLILDACLHKLLSLYYYLFLFLYIINSLSKLN